MVSVERRNDQARRVGEDRRKMNILVGIERRLTEDRRIGFDRRRDFWQ